ncbi:MAG TPA: hypothetical protein VNS33_02320 [Bradyrhizobium sp.]|nr:hypothetical protein [Bradyrhizobium sp.]
MEIGNKVSLMGIYGSQMHVEGAVPTILPKLVIAFWLNSDVDDVPEKCQVRVTGLDGNELLKADLEVTPTIDVSASEVKRVAITGAFTFSPFAVPQSGVLEVTAITERETLLAGHLHIHAPSVPATSGKQSPSE